MGYAIQPSPETTRRRTSSSSQKTASEDFFANPNKTRPENRCNPLKMRQGNHPAPTKTALGVHFKNYLDHVYAVSNDTGTIKEHYRYSAFGEVEIYSPAGQKLSDSAIGNTVLWNSRRFDFDTNLYYYLFRHYKADYGRWLGRDPLEEEGGANLYQFSENSVFDGFDVYGLDFIALMSYPVDLGDIPGTGINTGHAAGHYEIAYIKSCEPDDGIFVKGDQHNWITANNQHKRKHNAGISVLSSVELLNNDGKSRGNPGKWDAKLTHRGMRDIGNWGLLGVSEIVYDEFAPDATVFFEVIRTGESEDLKETWDLIIDQANRYRWAEQQGFENTGSSWHRIRVPYVPTPWQIIRALVLKQPRPLPYKIRRVWRKNPPAFKNWPNSRYWSPFGQKHTNNSNVFARYVLKQVGITHAESVARAHPPVGDSNPEDVSRLDYRGNPIKR